MTKFSVKVPSLCLFLYQNFMSLLDDSDAVNTGGCLVMDTPALTTFIISDCSRDGCSMENMHSLEKASINIKYSHDIDKFITSFSAVLSLDLCLTDEVVALLIYILLVRCDFIVASIDLHCCLFRCRFLIVPPSTSLD